MTFYSCWVLIQVASAAVPYVCPWSRTSLFCLSLESVVYGECFFAALFFARMGFVLYSDKRVGCLVVGATWVLFLLGCCS
jgi:hypothetical protein